MKRRRCDARIWLPALLGTACFALRALPNEPPAASSRARAVSLPQLYGAAPEAKQQRFGLVSAKSSVRLRVDGPGGELLTECLRVEGELQLGPAIDDGTITLRFDLASLRALPRQPAGVGGRDVLAVFGALGDGEVVYRGRRVATTTSDLPGVAHYTWLGTMHFGDRVLDQSIATWRCSLPGRALRLQGQLTIACADLGLPSHSWFALFEQEYSVTLGLDLAWKRVR